MRIAVIKIGTKVVLRRKNLCDLAGEIASVLDEGWKVILVSSGAAGLGRKGIDSKLGSRNTWHTRLLCGIGQSLLMRKWAEAFSCFNLYVAQILVSKDDFTTLKKLANLKLGIGQYSSLGVIPVVNENDLLTDKSLGNNFSDNDELAFRLASVLGAEILIYLTEVKGYYRDWADGRGKRIVKELSGQEVCREQVDDSGRGGMKNKIKYSLLAKSQGIDVYIASGLESNTISQIILEGKNPGTRANGGGIILKQNIRAGIVDECP